MLDRESTGKAQIHLPDKPMAAMHWLVLQVLSLVEIAIPRGCLMFAS